MGNLVEKIVLSRQALVGHKRRIPLAVVLPRPARGAGLDPKDIHLKFQFLYKTFEFLV